MDVNNTRFHLIYGLPDWERCLSETASQEGVPAEEVDVGWDRYSNTLALRRELSLFPRGRRDLPLLPSARRGAAVDRYGNWYWISHDRQKVFWSPSATRRAQVYWSQAPQPKPEAPGAFRPASEAKPAIAELAGLAVTEHQYLVVGNVTQPGLFLFDLHAGGEPLLLLLPDGVPFQPFDMAAAPGGGVWILDREHQAYWGLDCQFRVVTEPGLVQELEPETTFPFQPQGETPIVYPGRQFPQGFPIDAAHPISIAALPDGGVLILDSPLDGTTGSTLFHYHFSQPASPPMPLPSLEGVAADEETRPVVGHDMAYAPADGTLYVVERDGNQTIAFDLDLDAAASPPEPLQVRRDYLPMHFFGGRALVAWEDRVFYEVVGGAPGRDTAARWVQLRAVDQPRFRRAGGLVTYIFDGKERDCVWHRLFLDACIPAGTQVQVETRAVNAQDLEEARELLDAMPFAPEPVPYLRGSGSELPYFDPYADLDNLPEHTGTWELLFQGARGRFMQLRLVLSGNGRVTPQLRALRAYYPRFSYPRRFLPAVYQEDREGTRFLERLLANPEGFYTELEGKMTAVSVLFDPRSAPPEALDWLAGWVGLVLDPLWARVQHYRQRNGAKPNDQASERNYLWDRRRLFIRYALRLYAQRGTANGIKFALHLLLHPCLEELLERFTRAAAQDDLVLREEMERLELPYPTATMDERQLEDLLQAYLLSPRRPSRVRIVEHFLTRQGRAAVAGDPTRVGDSTEQEDKVKTCTHCFSVLIPEGLSAPEQAMVERLVELEKPAHTMFDVRRYWDYFLVGEARLGLDTVLGEESRFVPMILGRDYLAEGYLYPAHPMDVSERLISDRDRVGGRPL